MFNSGMPSRLRTSVCVESAQGIPGSLRHISHRAIAILRIPKLNIEVPVLEGTGDLILNRGVGTWKVQLIPGRTAMWQLPDIGWVLPRSQGHRPR